MKRFTEKDFYKHKKRKISKLHKCWKTLIAWEKTPNAKAFRKELDEIRF